ncbi:uncharacterized protein LOC123519340 isoform X2 [Portunus trituberculatus]|uniref:uncharacterized protein LOC123519340 isoform X2 n=1 Tax=Portunus trituberculatus TaxID=210409 RepID=UPI001E1CC6C0|nr:uncharacterized protein LOC123519340 isoform X2 [Portunus trituberculatus]
MSRNQTPVLTYFFGILLTGCAADDKRCEVLDVHVTPIEANSSFVYDTTYKDPSCTNKGELTRKLRRCNATFDYGDVRGEGEVNYCHGGMWMVTVSGNVNSACFHCWGFYLQHTIVLSFTYDLLNITLKDVPPTVKSWNLTIYKSTTEQDYKACKPRHGLTYIKKLFQDTHLKANITWSLVTLKHSFDPNACYCLVMNPISHLPLSPDNILFTTKDCRPTPPSRENGISPTGYLPKSTWEMVGWGVLAGTLLCFVAMIFVVLRLKRLVGSRTK